MTKTIGRLVLGAVLAVLAGGGGSGCGTDKVPGLATGSGGSGTGGAGPTAGSGGAPGVAATAGLQFNGAITFVRVAR